MMRTVFLIAAVSLLALTARADQAGLDEFRARLALTPERESQVRSIFEAYIEAQLKTLDKYDVDIGDRGGVASVDLQTMRALREEFPTDSAKIEERLAEVLSATQLAEFRRFRAEQEERLRERLLSRRMDEIVAKLELSAQQRDRVRPILKEHFKAQMAILDKHGVAPGNRDNADRPGFRTLRRLRKDMDEINERAEARLSDILSEAQFEVHKALKAEQREKLRALFFQR